MLFRVKEILYETIVGCMLCDIAVGNVFRLPDRSAGYSVGNGRISNRRSIRRDPVLKSESENVKQEESEENASSEIKDSEYPEADDTGKTVFVYVCGAVCQPGVYELSAQSRAYEAVAMAGGLLENARSDAVNLAEVLTDGQKLQIPYIGEDAVAEASGQTTATDSKDATDATVNINTATVDMLMTLKGIGQTRAEDIIAYREKHGSFQNKEDIMNVDGIKQGTYDKIKDNISVQ